MKKKLFVVAMVLLTVVNIVIMRANMQLGYDLEDKVREAPEIKVFQTDYNEGTQIVFNHDVHANGYGLECIECHHVESCGHCHKKEIIQAEIEESKVALHKSCLGCHKDWDVGPQQCDECHKR